MVILKKFYIHNTWLVSLLSISNIPSVYTVPVENNVRKLEF